MELTKGFVKSCNKPSILRECLLQAMDHVDALEKENKELKEAQRWRNFKDEPPEHHQWIEACYCEDMERQPRIDIRRWDDGMKYDVFNQELYIGWRPLPKAPEDK